MNFRCFLSILAFRCFLSILALRCKTLDTLGWVLYVPCYGLVTNIFPRGSPCLLLSSLLVSAVFLSYSILSSRFFEANHLLYDVFFTSINCLIWSSHVLRYFLLFRLYFSCIFVCSWLFCKFPHSFTTSFSFAFIRFKWRLTLSVYSHLMFSSFKSLIFKKNLLAFLKLSSYLAIEAKNLLLHITNNGQF